MKDRDLQKLTEQISLDYFNKPFKHKAFFNPRLRTTGGRYLLTTHNIEINRKYYEAHGIEELIGIIKHELCHYHLHLEGKGYRHRDQDFKELLEKVGAPKYCKPLPEEKEKMFLYRCENCFTLYRRKRRIDVKKYVCGKCRGRLEKVAKEESFQ